MMFLEQKTHQQEIGQIKPIDLLIKHGYRFP